MIRLTDFGCAYRGSTSPALEDISIELSIGQTLAIVGPRGSGKTTLALAAAGLLPLLYECVTTGKAGWENNGRDPAIPGVLKGDIGFLPERPAAVLSGLADNVFAEVAMALRNRGRTDDDVVQRVNASLENVGICHLATRHPFQLSGGEQKLVGLAAALAQDSRLIVLDCPFAGLDRNHSRQLAAAIEHFRSMGGAILITEHRLDLVAWLSCEVRLLELGRLVSRIHTTAGIPRSEIDSWRRAGLLAASILLADRGDVNPIPVDFSTVS